MGRAEAGPWPACVSKQSKLDCLLFCVLGVLLALALQGIAVSLPGGVSAMIFGDRKGRRPECAYEVFPSPLVLLGIAVCPYDEHFVTVDYQHKCELGHYEAERGADRSGHRERHFVSAVGTEHKRDQGLRNLHSSRAIA